MKIHKIEEAVAKAIRDVELELSVMESGERNQFNEDRESLQSELTLLKHIVQTIEDWNLQRARVSIDRMEKHREGKLEGE